MLADRTWMKVKNQSRQGTRFCCFFCVRPGLYFTERHMVEQRNNGGGSAECVCWHEGETKSNQNKASVTTETSCEEPDRPPISDTIWTSRRWGMHQLIVHTSIEFITWAVTSCRKTSITTFIILLLFSTCSCNNNFKNGYSSKIIVIFSVKTLKNKTIFPVFRRQKEKTVTDKKTMFRLKNVASWEVAVYTVLVLGRGRGCRRDRVRQRHRICTSHFHQLDVAQGDCIYNQARPESQVPVSFRGEMASPEPTASSDNLVRKCYGSISASRGQTWNRKGSVQHLSWNTCHIPRNHQELYVRMLRAHEGIER